MVVPDLIAQSYREAVALLRRISPGTLERAAKGDHDGAASLDFDFGRFFAEWNSDQRADSDTPSTVASAAFLVGETTRGAGDLEGGVRHFQNALLAAAGTEIGNYLRPRTFMEMAECFRRQANEALEQGESTLTAWDNAFKAFDSAIELLGEDAPEDIAALAACHINKAAILERFVVYDFQVPEDPVGEIRRELLEAFRLASKLPHPQVLQVKALTYLGDLELKGRDTAAAKKAYEGACQIQVSADGYKDPETHTVYLNIVRSCWENGELELAYHFLEGALESSSLLRADAERGVARQLGQLLGGVRMSSIPHGDLLVAMAFKAASEGEWEKAIRHMNDMEKNSLVFYQKTVSAIALLNSLAERYESMDHPDEAELARELKRHYGEIFRF